MEAHIKSFFLVCLITLASTSVAQEVGPLPEAAPSGDANVAKVLPFPYVAEITGDDVYIRSGPGTNYYACGKLYKGDRVTVVGSSFLWSRIVAPAGSFSWISARYVEIDPGSSDVGTVTANAVRVYAGAEERDPMHSTSMQLKLDKGEKVKLLGERKSDYLKIEPPEGAYVWVSTKYTNALAPVVTTPPILVTPPSHTPDTTPTLPTDVSVERAKLQEYYALQERMEAERLKPMAQQNYAVIKGALLQIADNRQAGKAARFARFALKQIDRFELAFEVARTVRLQDEQLQQVKDKIAKAQASRLAEIQDLGKFAVMGQFQTSTVYAQKMYQITDDSGKIVCYASPTGSTSAMNLSQFAGRKVGLIGTIEPHMQSGGALVRFSGVVELE
ncbi:MAG: SH3 domain-containing protein [Planctomycetota bacterium]|jgi:hypothetical protein